jgi:hypothetical protein
MRQLNPVKENYNVEELPPLILRGLIVRFELVT